MDGGLKSECLVCDRRFRAVLTTLQDAYGAQRKEKMQNSMSLYRCHTIFNVSLAYVL